MIDDSLVVGIFFVLYVLAIYFSWKFGHQKGLYDGAEACLEVMVDHNVVQRVVMPDRIEIVGTVDSCPVCSVKMGKQAMLIAENKKE